MPVTSLLCYVLRFKCCGFPSYVSNQDISMAIDTFQLPECLHEYDTEIVMPYWIPLSSFIPARWQMQEGARDNMGKGRKEPATYKETTAYSCFTLCSPVVRKYCSRSTLSNSEYRQLFCMDILNWLCSVLEVRSVWNMAVTAFSLHQGKCRVIALSVL